MEQDIPRHIIRYEDLVNDPKTALSGLCKFLLNVDDLTGTKVLKNIDSAVENYTGVYQTRPGGGGANKNYAKFTASMRKYVIDNAGDVMEKLGYMHQFKEDGNPFPPPAWVKEQNEANLKTAIENIKLDEVKSLVKTAPKWGFFEPIGAISSGVVVQFMKVKATIINRDKEEVKDRLYIYMNRHARGGDPEKVHEHIDMAKK